MPNRPDAWSERFVCLPHELIRRTWATPAPDPAEKHQYIECLIVASITAVLVYNREAYDHHLTGDQIRTLDAAAKAVLSMFEI